MTINLTDVTFDLLVAEQLHDIVPCSDESGCDRTAHWALTCPGGEHIDMLCDVHRDEEDQMNLDADEVKCVICQQRYPLPFPWVAL